MIEIRTYEGDGHDVAELVARVWRGAYAGRKWVPCWGRETLNYQILAQEARAADFLVAAYDAARLVGCFFAEPFTFRLPDGPVDGTLASWLTVEEGQSASCVAPRMLWEMQRRHRRAQKAFCLGYVVGDHTAPANKFWLSYAQSDPQNCQLVRRVGYWIRMVDHRAVARHGVHWHERVGARLLRWLQARPQVRPAAANDWGIREYKPDDFDACYEMHETVSANADLSIDWTRERFAFQLRDPHATARTLVLEHAGRIAGFVNYHEVDLLARASVSAAFIDRLAAPQASHHQRISLINAALGRMAQEGIQLAIMLGTANLPGRALLTSGFLPLPALDHLICLFKSPRITLPPAPSLSLLLR